MNTEFLANEMVKCGWEKIYEDLNAFQWDGDGEYGMCAQISKTGHIEYAMFEDGDVASTYSGDVGEVLNPSEAFKVLTAERIVGEHDLDIDNKDLAEEIRNLARM
jgi:hypothetical protein